MLEPTNIADDCSRNIKHFGYNLKEEKIPMHGKPDNKPVVDENGAKDVDLRI